MHPPWSVSTCMCIFTPPFCSAGSALTTTCVQAAAEQMVLAADGMPHSARVARLDGGSLQPGAPTAASPLRARPGNRGLIRSQFETTYAHAQQWAQRFACLMRV
eukprot:366412-Chlamydomonas_euryale.AAC.23